MTTVLPNMEYHNSFMTAYLADTPAGKANRRAGLVGQMVAYRWDETLNCYFGGNVHSVHIRNGRLACEVWTQQNISTPKKRIEGPQPLAILLDPADGQSWYTLARGWTMTRYYPAYQNAQGSGDDKRAAATADAATYADADFQAIDAAVAQALANQP